MEKLAEARSHVAMMKGMTYDDLPADWPQRPLIDPTLTADVVDLVVRETDRAEGCLGILLCNHEHRLVQPLTINDIDDVPAHERRRPFDLFMSGFGDRLGGIVVAVGRPRGYVPDDVARGWHEAAIAASREHDVPLLGTYLATVHAVIEMPRWTGLAAAG